MSYVVGTAGHIDHGKSTLVKSLTGVDTAHLPQEKKRGMTIDLGFAFFKGSNSELIGVIDVPGHERFIRNMVAGVWSLDIVLFVVAADEGWMQMSTEHLKVLTAMGIENVILVITKSDLIDDDMLALVEEESLEHFLDIAGYVPDSIQVSARQNRGIDALRNHICRTIDKMDKQEISRVNQERQAHLYVDRVFTVNGIGTTVTGSLCGGDINIGQKLYLQPSGKKVHVKSLQSYYRDIDVAKPVSRVAIGLKVKKKDVERGFCLTTSNEVGFVVNEILIRLDNTLFTNKCRNNSEVEVAFGTFNTLAKIFVFKDTNLARLRLKESAFCFWNQRGLLIQHGGSRIVNCGNIVWCGEVERQHRSDLYTLLMALPEKPTWEDYAKVNISLYGYAKRGNYQLDESSYKICGEWLFTEECFERCYKQVEVAFGQEQAGLSANELSGKLHLPLGMLQALLSQMVKERKCCLIGEVFSLYNGGSEVQLSSIAKQILSRMSKAGKQGFEAGKEKIPGAQKELRNLVRLGFAVPLENKIYYEKKIYEQLVTELIYDYKINACFSIADAKERTGLSRKYIIPILNRMETDGWIKRLENVRQVIRRL